MWDFIITLTCDLDLDFNVSEVKQYDVSMLGFYHRLFYINCEVGLQQILFVNLNSLDVYSYLGLFS